MKPKRKGRKEVLVGWTRRSNDFAYHRGDFIRGDKMCLNLLRGNPNPKNYTTTNWWKKISITIEEVL